MVSRLCFAAALLLVVVQLVSAETEDDVIKRFESLDIDNILSNIRLLKGYTNCLNDKGPCTPDAKYIKDHVEVHVKEGCANCGPKLRAMSKKLINAVKEKYPTEYDDLLGKWDPNHERAAELDKFLNE